MQPTGESNSAELWTSAAVVTSKAYLQGFNKEHSNLPSAIHYSNSSLSGPGITVLTLMASEITYYNIPLNQQVRYTCSGLFFLYFPPLLLCVLFWLSQLSFYIFFTCFWGWPPFFSTKRTGSTDGRSLDISLLTYSSIFFLGVSIMGDRIQRFWIFQMHLLF